MVLRAMSGWGRARSFTGLCALTLAAGSAITAGLATAPAVLAAPEPDPVPRRWELQIEPGPLRSATIDVPNYGPRKFFYMTLSQARPSSSFVWRSNSVFQVACSSAV